MHVPFPPVFKYVESNRLWECLLASADKKRELEKKLWKLLRDLKNECAIVKAASEMLDVMNRALFRTIELDAQLIDLYAYRHDPINIEEIREIILERDATIKIASHYVSREFLEFVSKDRKDYLLDEICRVMVVIMSCSSVTEICPMFEFLYSLDNPDYSEFVLTDVLSTSAEYIRSPEGQAILREAILRRWRSDDQSNSDSDLEDEEFVGSANSMVVLMQSSHGSLS